MNRSIVALAFALALVCSATPGFGRAFTPHIPLALDGDESVATTDDARAILVNPAAMGLRYPAELYEGFARYNQNDEWNTTLLATRRFGLLALRQRDSSQTYGWATAVGNEKLRFGMSQYLLVSGVPQEHVYDYRFGLLSRPTPWASIGFTINRAFQPRFRGERRARHYTLGVGWRPFAMSGPNASGWGTRLTLSGDAIVVDDGEWGQTRVLVGAQFEPVPGVVLQGSVGDHRNGHLGVTLRGVRWAAHGGDIREKGRPLYQSYSVAVHTGDEPSAIDPVPQARVSVVRVGGVLADESMGGLALAGGDATVAAGPVRRALRRAAEDPLTRGVLLDLRGVGGMAQIEELRPYVQRVRDAGKPVVAYLEYGGTRGDLYLASACDRIVAGEEAPFTNLGLRTERRYWRSALARAGVKLERTSTGLYKSAYRNFSVDSMPAADSVVVEHDLDVRQQLFVDAVSAGRRLAPGQLLPFLDGRYWTSAQLAAAGVIDSVGYREDAVRLVGRLAKLGDEPRLVSMSRVPAADRAWTRRSPVAIVYAGGGIEVGRSGNDVLTGPTLGSETLVAELERAFRTPGVRVVVLRIESPGGSSLASNLMDHAVQKLRRETHKPLVVSMGSVAASGGYYLACHGDVIYADRHTRTGSIGVLDVKPSFQGLYEKLGVRSSQFDRGEFMGASSWSRDWTERDQAAADSTIQLLYRGFVGKVADGRHLSFDAVHAVAQGRVWMGDDALERKLVDHVGGLDDALAEARRRAGVPAGEQIAPLEFGRPPASLVERLLGGWVRATVARELRTPDFRDAWMVDPELLDPVTE